MTTPKQALNLIEDALQQINTQMRRLHASGYLALEEYNAALQSCDTVFAIVEVCNKREPAVR